MKAGFVTLKMPPDYVPSFMPERRVRMDKCPNCGAPEVDWCGAETHYKCGSSDYDQRPGTFNQSINCAKAEIRAEALRDAGERAKKWMLDPEPGCSLLTAILAGEVKE